MIDLFRLQAEAATRFLFKKRSFTFQFMLVILCAEVIKDTPSAKNGMSIHFQISAYFFHDAFMRHYQRRCNRCTFVVVRISPRFAVRTNPQRRIIVPEWLASNDKLVLSQHKCSKSPYVFRLEKRCWFLFVSLIQMYYI